MAAAAILNFAKNVNNSGLDTDMYIKFKWEDAPRPYGDDHLTKSGNRKLIRDKSSNERLEHKCIADIWTKFYIDLKHHTINMTECSKCTRLEYPPTWISENVNNSELDTAICAKFGGQMHHGYA